MPRIQSFEVYAADLLFRSAFKHAAAERTVSNSVFLKCHLDDGTVGWGESLPLDYVTGETQDGVCEMLRIRILPRLLGRNFASFEDVRTFLETCNGQAPADWVHPRAPQTAAWCTVDLALLDTFGKAFKRSVFPAHDALRSDVRYSTVVSTGHGWPVIRKLLKMRLGRIRSIKVKVDQEVDLPAFRTARWILGPRADLRVDANMAWTEAQALSAMQTLAELGVRSFEQPLPADDLEHSASLIRKTGLQVMADESLNDDASLDTIIATKAFNAVSVRISKCGGLIAALNRCKKAAEAGLVIQVGCQVGESSLLSAAHLALLHLFPNVRYAEGCFGLHLLHEDPVHPIVQFGYGGRWPKIPECAGPAGYGLNVAVDQNTLRRYTLNHWDITG